jgi:hypothetical protein
MSGFWLWTKELLRDYALTLSYVFAQLVVIRIWPRQKDHRPARAPRPPSDPLWFVPVYLWGLQSLYQLCEVHSGLTGTEGTKGCVGSSILLYGMLFTANLYLLLLVLAGCFLSEHWARKRGWPARAPQATLPLGAVAALIGVQAGWGITYLLFMF